MIPVDFHSWLLDTVEQGQAHFVWREGRRISRLYRIREKRFYSAAHTFRELEVLLGVACEFSQPLKGLWRHKHSKPPVHLVRILLAATASLRTVMLSRWIEILRRVHGQTDKAPSCSTGVRHHWSLANEHLAGVMISNSDYCFSNGEKSEVLLLVIISIFVNVVKFVFTWRQLKIRILWQNFTLCDIIHNGMLTSSVCSEKCVNQSNLICYLDNFRHIWFLAEQKRGLKSFANVEALATDLTFWKPPKDMYKIHGENGPV